MNKQHPEISPEEELRRAWGYASHADMLLVGRLSYGLLAQSMLLAAFAAVFGLVGSSDNHLKWQAIAIEVAFCCFGIWYSLFLISLFRALGIRMKHMREMYLEPLDPVYRAYIRCTPIPSITQASIAIALAVLWTTLLGVTFVGVFFY